MAKFIIPKIRTVHRDSVGRHTNHPVNINHCTQLISQNNDNGYGKQYPVLIFVGCNVTWYYGEDGHQIRDEQYFEILEENS